MIHLTSARVYQQDERVRTNTEGMGVKNKGLKAAQKNDVVVQEVW